MRGISAAALTALLVSGCAPKAYVRPGYLEAPPKSLAVLPFAITYPYDLAPGQPLPESHLVGSSALRKTFYYALTPLGYQDRRLAEVDAVLAEKWGPLGQEAWRRASPQELGQALGVDAVIYGEVDRLMHFTTPLYTETSLAARFRMVDARTGEVLWRKNAKAAERGGALLKKGQVVDFVKDQVRSFKPEVKFLRISDKAVRSLMKDFPNPPLGDRLTQEPATPSARPRLALLPLLPEDRGDAKAVEPLRRYLAASLQESPFEILELQLVDAALEAQAGVKSVDAAALAAAQALGADVILRGTVMDYGRGYAVVQSWVKAELELELIDGATGQTLWKEKRKNSRQAGILKGPTGYKSLATGALKGLKTSNLERVANNLTRLMVEDLSSSPAVRAYVGEWEPASL